MYRATSLTVHHVPTRASVLPRRDAWRMWSGSVLAALVVFVHESVFRISTVEQFQNDGQVLVRLGICAACGLYGLAHIGRYFQHLFQFPGVLGLLLCGWAMLTLQAALDLNYSAAAVMALFCMILFAPDVLLEVGGRRLAQVVLWTLTVYLVASWVVNFTWPELAVDEADDLSSMLGIRRVGGLHSYNGLGRQAALTLCLAAAIGASGAAGWWALSIPIVLALATLVGTESRTAILAAMAALGVIVAESVSRRTKLWLLLCGGLAAALAALAIVNVTDTANVDDFMASISRSGDPLEMYHLTGRYELWEFVVERIQNSPLLGYGWGGTRFPLLDGPWSTHHAHNLILNVALGAGVMAGAIVAVMLAWQLIAAVVRPDMFPDVLAALVLVGGLADQMMFGPIPDSHTLLWLVSLHWRAMGGSLIDDAPALEWSFA